MIKLRILTHDGESFVEHVDAYSAEELNEKINDSSLLTIVIGNRIISRIKVAEISIIENTE